MALQLQAPSTRTHLASPSPLAPRGNAGLRPPSDRFALRSSFFSSSLSLLLPPKQQKPLAKAAPKFSMRVASKEAYICRDCGYHSSCLVQLFVLFLLSSWGRWWIKSLTIMMLNDAGIYTMRELLLKSYLTITTALVITSLAFSKWNLQLSST